ncbi:MAG: tRNA pseudouridine(38-40) synthase TruA [Flavobacteriaceae bacterium]|nr:tRNA pseudouridine(38-40) synthase TruA [Flavobacteriaceae bacterium]
MRYFIELSYKGTAYHGWQKQPDAISVQEVLEKALSVLLRETVAIVGAGRTDTGVHASQIFAHFDFTELNCTQLTRKLNSYLPSDIAIHGIQEMYDEAHARFDAISRSYEYVITKNKNPFTTELAFYFKPELDVEKMNEAAKVLFNYENFKCFSKSKTDVKTYHCIITEAEWKWKGNELIFFVSANRFLRNMVRAIVGTLLEVGLGKMEVAEMHEVIKSQNRGKAGASVPGHALYLTKVEYPREIFK